jgi:hypothetical protein
MVIAFEDLAPETAAAAQARWDEALAAGMAVGRVHLDWASVEPDSGIVDAAILAAELQRMQDDGLAPIVALYALDTEGATLPADLQARFAAGLPMDAPEILARYRALLDWAVPMIVDAGGWGVILANENDGYLIEEPDQVGAVARFYRNARQHVHALAPGLAVTATHTGDGPLHGAPHYAVLVEELDVASFNYYPLDPGTLELFAPTPARIAADMASFVAAAAGRPVIFQELGCPAGYADASLIGTSPADQRAFLASAFAVIEQDPRIRAAFVFQLVDWSEELVELVYGDFLDQQDVPQVYRDRLAEWLLTTGLITDEDGAVRPAWSEFLAAVQRMGCASKIAYGVPRVRHRASE